eukprot:TRINITY_DN29222_c1_g1_i1.p1 TRINITY_DN29222_c1_g1~~TRINITY_DN29222_c1_g1_i1.p1  ORF type:complete len:620 (+),score=84.83 TRINITY_DN29222_c1_g1_i1:219-2078(+)
MNGGCAPKPPTVTEGLKKLWRLLSICRLSNWRSRFCSLIGQLLLKVGSRIYSQLMVVRMFESLFKRDKSRFAKCLIQNFAASVFHGWVDQKLYSLQQTFQVDIYRALSLDLVGRYMKVNGYLTLPTFGGAGSSKKIIDPETRLTDDIRSFSESFTDLSIKASYPLLELVCLGGTLTQVAGLGNSSLLYGYLIGASIVIRSMMPDFHTLQMKVSEADGRLKFWHSRIRAHAESIAFFGGGHSESQGAAQQFEKVLSLSMYRKRVQHFFDCVRECIVDIGSNAVQNHLRFDFAVNSFTNATVDGVAKLAGQQHMIWDTNEALRKNVKELIEIFDSCNTLSGTIQRLAEMDDQISRKELPLKPQDSEDTAHSTSSTDSKLGTRSVLQLKNVDIVTPGGLCLSRGITADVMQSKRMFVTGPNASGKTALFRVLAGLWPLEKGTVDVKGKIVFVPQKPYSVTGTLLDQVLYPECLPPWSACEEEESIAKRRTEVEQHALELLRLVQIDYLVDRWAEKDLEGAVKVKGWYAIQEWEKTLSLGEQQRLGIARMLHKKPDFAVLDECTDAVSVDVERTLYEICVQKGINCVTISKRLGLEDFHEVELKLGESTEAGHCLSPVAASGR